MSTIDPDYRELVSWDYFDNPIIDDDAISTMLFGSTVDGIVIEPDDGGKSRITIDFVETEIPTGGEDDRIAHAGRLVFRGAQILLSVEPLASIAEKYYQVERFEYVGDGEFVIGFADAEDEPDFTIAARSMSLQVFA